MSADESIDAWLAEGGYGLPATRAIARTLLEEAQLTRPGKLRISSVKLPRAVEVLAQRLYLCCGSQGCVGLADSSGRQRVACDPRARCEGCGGSDNKRAEAALIEAFRRHRISKLLVVGGSPSVREELEKSLGTALELRTVDGTQRRPADRAKSDLEWADLVLVWGASELHHKVSLLYTQVPPAMRKKTVHVLKRGVAALLSAAIEHLALINR